MFKKILAMLATSAALATAPAAHAILINDTADDFTFNFVQLLGTGTNQIRATASFDVTAVSASTISILVSVTNNSVLTTFTEAGLASVGLATTPTVTGATISGGSVFLNVNTDDIPSLGAIDLCAYAGNNCNGGPQNDLLAAGATDTFTLILTGAFGNGLLVTDAGVKWQTTDGSFEVYSCPSTAPCTPGTPREQVPEPGTLLLVGAGALALAYRRRRVA